MRRRLSLDFLARHAAVRLEDARRRKLAQLMADHVFRDVHGHEDLAVVNAEGVADEIRRNGRTTGPVWMGFFTPVFTAFSIFSSRW
jgi:hypothetical protein